MERGIQPWVLPWIVVVIYPGLILVFDDAINGYHASGSLLMATAAVLAMLLAASIPMLVLRALLDMRDEAGPTMARGILFLMFTTSSLFTLGLRFIRAAGVVQGPRIMAVWAAVWLAIGLMLYVANARRVRNVPPAHARPIKWVRVVHGVTALCLLLGFLLAHLANHDLALWSVELHQATMTWLRLWYRSEWVEPVLLTLLVLMIGTGIPMVLHYSRQRMDAFRIVQAATGVYVGVFICSHVVAVLSGREAGAETDWFFAAGPHSLLDGTAMISRLIPHYIFGTFFLILHVACGLRVVLLQHGAARIFANRAVYGLASVGVVVTALAAAALLGFHVNVSD